MLERMIGIGILLGVLGAIFGSFAGAQVWRLRARQLDEDKKAGESYDKKEYARLKSLLGKTKTRDRSQCLHCGHVLGARDLIPVVSWVLGKGSCRYCHKSIGWFELLMELGVATVFVVSFVFWPFDLTTFSEGVLFAVWLAIVVLLAILFAYDVKWFLLPDKIMYPAMVLAVIYAGLATLLSQQDVIYVLLNIAGSLAILSGLYFLLWAFSRGQWIGFGDIKLGVVLAFLVIDWQLAFLTLFLANLIGCLIVIPGLLSKKMTRKTHVPFGPMLIGATGISVLFGPAIIQWYITVTTNMLML